MRSWKKPTPDRIDRAVALLAHVEQYRYFFDRLENPEWLKPLWEKGFFKHPPQPEHNEEEGTIRFPPWPEARYLARMAKHKPELVAEIIRKMGDTDNAAVLSDLVGALRAMPPPISALLAEKARRWAEVPYLLLPEELGELISHLAKGGKTEEALEVAMVLLDILPDPRQRQVPGPSSLPPEPRARFDAWHYEQILKKHYPDLVRAAGLPALALLCDLLGEAIELSRHLGDDLEPEDYSSVWRPAIEDSPQNLGHTLKDALVSGIRDAAELLVRSGRVTVEEMVVALDGRQWKVFRRIALHVIRLFPDQTGTLATAKLTDRALFEDVGLRHEYVLMLRDRFPRLTAEDQAQILGWIEEGPEVDWWKQWRAGETGQQPTQEEVVRYQEIWRRDWLARIGPENLPDEWKERYRNLCERYGEPEHLEFPVYTGVVWEGPTSPKTANELKAMSVEEVVGFLRSWKPPENIFREPSPEGLGRVLSSIVAEDPARFAAEAPKFKELDPTYVRAILSGLRDALKQGRTFDWEQVLVLCGWVLSQPREIPGRKVREMDADPDWGWTRKAIADLLSAGFEDRSGGIPFHLRERVWAILKPLTDDPDPTPEREQRYGGSNMDPVTLSINTTRGEAMHAVVRYALWVQRHLEKEAEVEEPLRRGFAEMPEVREVLEAHLDPDRESSLAIRAVYGQWFPWLVLLDSDWARSHAETIFPRGQQREAFFEAAWNTHVAFCQPYDSVWEILRPQYGHAVERIGIRHHDTRWLGDPDEKLAEHLMAFYWRGKLELDDPLLAAFWQRATDGFRAHAIAFVGQSLERTEGDVPEKILEQLKRLWERRLAAAREAQDPSDSVEEMAAFGWWFVSGKFDVDWAIAQLSASLQLARKSDPDHMVLERLAEAVQTHPQESVECLRMIAEGDREGWTIYASRDHVRMILETGLRNPSAAEDTRWVVNYLGSRGFLDFRDLLGR